MPVVEISRMVLAAVKLPAGKSMQTTWPSCNPPGVISPAVEQAA
jgi:hypothetical protein